MMSGDEFYGDDVTSPLERPAFLPRAGWASQCARLPIIEECSTCEGRGGEIENDMQGDGVWMTPVTYFIPCDDCLMNALCPKCSRAIPEGEAQVAAEDTEKWTCGACGWTLDMGRFEPSEDDYTEGY